MARSIPFLLFGQSYGVQGYGSRFSHWAFAVAMRRAIATNAAAITSRLGVGVASGDMTQLRNVAVNGSAIRQANAQGNGWWVNDDNSAGPLLTDAVNAINGYAVRPRIAIWSHGERDVQFADTPADVALVKTAVTDRLFPALRNAMIPGNPTGVRIFIDMLGFRIAADEAREHMMREMMLDVLISTQGAFRGAEKYAVELDATLHPTQIGYQTLGAHTGRKIAHFLATGDQLEAPSIGSVVRIGNSVVLSIDVPAGKTLVRPAHPAHIGLYNGGGERLPYAASWSGDTLVLLTPSPVATLRYPAREEYFDPTRIIRLTNPTDPIFPGEPGLPLQSRLPHTF